MDCHLPARLIFGGALNVSLGCSEIWGVKAWMDCLSDLFSKKLETYGLVDIVPHVLNPTWSNTRVGNESIAKRLDRIMVSADFLDLDLHFCQWIGCGRYSNHHPIFL